MALFQRFACGVFALFFLWTASGEIASAQSQANAGTIQGTVSDASGQLISNAKVMLTNTGTNLTRDLKTDSQGRFDGVLLPLGSYKVTVDASGFGTLVREGLDLAVGQTITLALQVSVSQLQQTVDVKEDAPIIETSRVEDSTYLDQRSVQTLPNNGRNFLTLVPLTPGVAIVQGPDGAEITITATRASTTTSQSTERTTTIRSSASSAAGKDPHSRSASMPSRNSRWSLPTLPRNLAAAAAAS